jgi:tetratricopeptide (TPR) repeat protein
MKVDMACEQQVLLLLCLNNAGVDAFERGLLKKALKFFQVALHLIAKSSTGTPECHKKMSKTMLRKVVKTQSDRFTPNQTFDFVYSETFGKHSRQTRRQKVVMEKCDDASTYIFQKMFSVQASNSVGILEQTSIDQLTAVILFNLGICHHLCQGHIEDATRCYELAIQSSWEIESKILQVVCWNNLLHIFSNYLRQENEFAQCCIREIAETMCESWFSHYFSRMTWADKQGIFFNVFLFSSLLNLAPAA